MNQNEKGSPEIPGEQEYERAIYLINSGHYKESIPLFQKSASLNYPPSFLWLHSLTEDKNEKEKWMLKTESNFTWYQSKAQDGKPDSLYNLGYCFHLKIGTKRNQEKAAVLFIKAAEQGNAAAQWNLGYCYHYGMGVPRDIKRAVELYSKAADQGNAIAQINLGYCYQYGVEVPKDIKKAIELFSKAAEQGHAVAQLNLGTCYMSGEGVIEDINRTIEFYTKAAEQGNVIAQYNLGNLYRYGAKIPKDIKKSVEWYIKAAEQGFANSQFELYNVTIDMQIIRDIFKMQKTLTRLNTHIEDEGAQAIGDALKINSTLTQLFIDRTDITLLGLQAIGDALKINKALTQLSLQNNKIGEIGAQVIADTLKVNSGLTQLDLSDNYIGDKGAQAIADALKASKFTIKEMKLTNTSISNIEQSLKIRKMLLILNIANNKIGDEGISAIAEMLKVNNSLQELNITNNNFTDFSKLGNALKCNRSLIEFRIDKDELKFKELQKELQFNICLLSIEQFFYTSKTPKIGEILKRNKEIQKTLSKRIFQCKDTHLSLLDYKILERVNVVVIFENVWKLHQTQQTGKTYEECLREYWELISLNGFSKYFLFILGVCKLNQIPPFRNHLLGVPKEILHYIGSFLNPKEFRYPNYLDQRAKLTE